MLNTIYQFGLVYALPLITCTLFVGYLVVLSVIDLQRGLLPDNLTLSLLWLGLIVHVLYTPHYLASGVIGAVGGYLFFWAVYWLMKIMTGVEGLGYGDFKLMAALGAWLGWQYLPWVAVFASMAGIILYALRYIFSGNKGEIVFGPFLAAAGGSIYISQRVYSLADPL